MLAHTQDAMVPAMANDNVADADAGALEGAGMRADLEALHAASFGWALSCCGGRRDEAEEALQTTYLKVLDGRARFRGRSSVKTWLFGVVRRTAAEQRRRRAFRGLKLARFAAERPPASRALPEDRDQRLDASRRLEGLLDRLAGRQREVLHLVFYQELTIEQAAQVMRVGLGTARTHYQRGKRALKQLLTEEAPV